MERWGGRRNNGRSCEKAKAKPAAKMENRKMCWGARQRIDRQLSNYNLRRLLCPKSGRQREAPPILVAFTKEFFLSWPEWFSFFLLWTCFPFVSFFFYQNLSSAFAFSTRKQLFHEQRASTSEFCKVCKVNKIWKKKKKKKFKKKKKKKTSPIESGCRENSPRGPALVRDYDTFLVY